MLTLQKHYRSYLNYLTRPAGTQLRFNVAHCIDVETTFKIRFMSAGLGYVDDP